MTAPSYKAADSSGHGRHATPVFADPATPGTQWHQPGPYAGGVNNFSTLMPCASASYGPQTASFCCWINYLGTAGIGTFGMFFNSSTAGSETNAFGVQVTSFGNPTITSPQGLSTISSAFVSVVLAHVFPLDGLFHFYAFRRTSPNFYDVFRDNVLLGNVHADEGSSGIFSINFGGFLIPCYMAGLAAFGTPMTDGQIAAYYAAGTSNQDYRAAILADSPSALWMLDDPGAGWTVGRIGMGSNDPSAGTGHGTLLCSDSFTRANNTTVPGSTNGNGSLDPLPWTVTLGTWGILSNQMYSPSGDPSSFESRVLIDPGVSDFDAGWTNTWSATPAGTSFNFRYVDADNYIELEVDNTQCILRKQMSGSPVGLTSNLFAPSLGDRIRVRCDGSTITVYRNEVVEATVTDSFNSSATPLGFHCYNANSKDRVEDFVLVGL